MKIVFMGTPEFSVPSLSMLIDEGYDVALVVTQPDKPKGRGGKVAMPPVKEFAILKDIKVLQPPRVKSLDFLSELKALNPDLLVTVAYGQLLSKEILEVPKLGCINVHASLLPKYRGAAPINWSIINGEKVTGITTMFTDIGMDTGDMLLKEETTITPDITAAELHDSLKIIGAKVLKDTLKLLKDNALIRHIQQNDEASLAPMMKKDTGHIDWSHNVLAIHNLVRGTNSWPLAYTSYKGNRMKVFKTQVVELNKINKTPGTILEVNKNGILVASLDGLIRILEIQFDSSKKMSVEDYIRGNKIDVGEILE